MITNIIATIIVSVVTNVYAPKQYKSTICYATYPAQIEERWVDDQYMGSIGGWNGLPVETRDNPDVRITEVRKIKTLSFELEGKEWKAEISNDLISSKRKKRIVETTEQWVEETK